MADEPTNQPPSNSEDSVEKALAPDSAAPPTVPAAQSASTRSNNQPANDYASGGSWGSIPIMNSGMTFSEVGSSGLRAFSGWVREEYLPQLVGRQGAQKYREMSDNSPTIGGVLFAINATMRKVEWRVEPANDSGEAAEAADFVESNMHDMSETWEEHIAEALSMLQYGYAPHEIVYKKRLGRDPQEDDPAEPGEKAPKSKYDDGKIGWRRLPLRGQDTVLKWFFGRHGQTKGMTQQPWTGPIVDLPIEKMLLFRPVSYKGNPEGRSILRNSYVPYYYSKRMKEQEAILAERLGGIPVISVPLELITAARGGNSEALAAYNGYKAMATNIRIDEQMGLVLPSNTFPTAAGLSSVKMYSFELAAPGGSGKASMDFDKTITRYDLSMMTSVLADFLALGHGARGTQALAVSKTDMFFQAIEGFLNTMASIYNRFAITRLFELNGMDMDLLPEIKPDLAQTVDIDALGNFVLKLSQAGMPLFPNQQLSSFILDAGGLPDISEDDEMAQMVAGVHPDQVNRDEERADVMLDGLKNPPEPVPGKDGGPPKPPMTPMQKAVLVEVRKRMLRLSGPRFEIRTGKRSPGRHSHGRGKRAGTSAKK